MTDTKPTTYPDRPDRLVAALEELRKANESLRGNIRGLEAKIKTIESQRKWLQDEVFKRNVELRSAWSERDEALRKLGEIKDILIEGDHEERDSDDATADA